MSVKTFYLYDEFDNRFTEPMVCQRDPIDTDNWLCPPNSVDVAPPVDWEVLDGEAYFLVEGSWVKQDYMVGKPYWISGSTQDSEIYTEHMYRTGNLPEDAVFTKPVERLREEFKSLIIQDHFSDEANYKTFHNGEEVDFGVLQIMKLLENSVDPTVTVLGVTNNQFVINTADIPTIIADSYADILAKKQAFQNKLSPLDGMTEESEMQTYVDSIIGV